MCSCAHTKQKPGETEALLEYTASAGGTMDRPNDPDKRTSGAPRNHTLDEEGILNPWYCTADCRIVAYGFPPYYPRLSRNRHDQGGRATENWKEESAAVTVWLMFGIGKIDQDWAVFCAACDYWTGLHEWGVDKRLSDNNKNNKYRQLPTGVVSSCLYQVTFKYYLFFDRVLD